MKLKVSKSLFLLRVNPRRRAVMKSFSRFWICVATLALGTGISMNLDAKEVDTFSLANESITDVATLLDKEINVHLMAAIEASNRASTVCSKKALYGSIRKEFSNHVFDRFNKKLLRSTTFPKTTLKVADSIYSNVGPSAPILWIQVKLGSDLIAIQYNGIRFGLDKLEHFFGSGYLYFEKRYLEHAPLSEALSFGAKREIGILGGYTTGVISFADLSANFSGMRFWNHLLNENPDVIGDQAKEPYVACNDSRWTLIRPVTLRNYVDRTWDEAFNCNRYKSIALARSVQSNIEQLSRKFNKALSCENHEAELASFESKYRSIAPWILNLKETEIDRRFPNRSGYRLPAAEDAI
ncbi:MAG: hypothetical protein O7F71_02935 [Gammaproteobacteria bacterium]|nr:hypothetical protein [Gammaproteobacteria bacterium]